MTVEIKIFGETASQTLEELRDLSRGLVARSSTEHVPTTNVRERVAENPQTFVGDGTETTFAVTNTPRAGETAEQTAARRERGKPAPGRARRTKEEIAEDEAADAADAASTTGQAISTGGERINPEDEATASQDAADEAAEDEANREPEKPLTLDDVKNAVGLYVERFGAGDFEKGRQIASEDGPGLFVDVLGKPPAGESFWKFSILPTDQDKLAAMVRAWKDAAAAPERYKRKGA